MLREDTAAWDLLVAADVFVCLEALEEVFAAARAGLRDGGWRVFSVEHVPGGDRPVQGVSGRFMQPPAYIRACAAQAGLEVVHELECVVRKEWNEDVPGRLYALRAGVGATP